jgi:hypothetical protein
MRGGTVRNATAVPQVAVDLPEYPSANASTAPAAARTARNKFGRCNPTRVAVRRGAPKSLLARGTKPDTFAVRADPPKRAAQPRASPAEPPAGAKQRRRRPAVQQNHPTSRASAGLRRGRGSISRCFYKNWCAGRAPIYHNANSLWSVSLFLRKRAVEKERRRVRIPLAWGEMPRQGGPSLKRLHRQALAQPRTY